ncbi:MAG: GNAT family N-acetyltransferase [Candidatus Binatia bacterium]
MTIVRKVVSQEGLKRARSIRLRVFVKEQNVPREIELDTDDQRATHFLAFIAGRAVGTARVVINGKQAKVGRMAVLKSFRKKGVGREILEQSLKLAWKKGVNSLILHAQVPVVGFYEKRGFRCVGRTFMEAGIPHRKMILARESRVK